MKITELHLNEGATGALAPIAAAKGEKAATTAAAGTAGTSSALRAAANKTGSYTQAGGLPTPQMQVTPTMKTPLPGVKPTATPAATPQTATGGGVPPVPPAAGSKALAAPSARNQSSGQMRGRGALTTPQGAQMSAPAAQTATAPAARKSFDTSNATDAQVKTPGATPAPAGASVGKKLAAGAALGGLGYMATQGSDKSQRNTSAPPPNAPGEAPATAPTTGSTATAAPTTGSTSTTAQPGAARTSQADLAAMHQQAVKTGNAASSQKAGDAWQTPAATSATGGTTAGGATGGSFADAFKAARAQHGGPGGKFTWNGKEYQTNVKGEPYVNNPVAVGQGASASSTNPATPTTTAGSVSGTTLSKPTAPTSGSSTGTSTKPTGGIGPVQAATIASGQPDDVTGVDAAVAANKLRPQGAATAPTTATAPTPTTATAPTYSANNPHVPKPDTSKQDAWEKLSPAQQKWMGGADPTDPYIAARMRSSVPDTPAVTKESMELNMLRKFSGLEESKMSDLKSRVHKGSYGTSYDGDDEKKPAASTEKRGRGRPKKGADDSGEVKKYDSSALSGVFGGGKKPKKEIGKVSKKHTLKDWVEEVAEGKKEKEPEGLYSTKRHETDGQRIARLAKEKRQAEKKKEQDVAEGKKADKDYDKDGKIETGKKEHEGSVGNAIEKEKAKETVKEGVNMDLITSLLRKLDNPMNPRGFNIAHAVERGDRETLENIISRHINHDDEFQNVPHRHKMELRDACMEHYLNPSEIEEGFAVAAPQYQPGETVYFRGKPGQVDRIEGEKCFVLLKTGDMDVWPTSQVSKEPQSMFSTFKKDATDIGKGLKGFLTGKSEVDESPFAYAAHQAKAHGDEKFSLGGKTFNVKESKDIQLESWNNQLESLLTGKVINESVTISTTSGDQGGDTVTVNATDNDAHEILALLRNAGMGGLHKNDESPSQSPYGAPMSQDQGGEEGGEFDAELVAVNPEVMDNGDDMLSLLKKMTTAGHAHVDGGEEQGQEQGQEQGSNDYADEEGSDEQDSDEQDSDEEGSEEQDSGEEEETNENLEIRANPAGAASADQAKEIGAQSPQQGGKEPNYAYKIGEDGLPDQFATKGNREALPEGELEENFTAQNTETGEEYKLDETGMDMVPDDPDMNTGALKEADTETCESCGESSCGCHQLEEGDAEYANSDDNQADQDMEFMMNVISGGLNGKKKMYQHNYKGGDNPMAMQESEDLLAAFKKLSGIK